VARMKFSVVKIAGLESQVQMEYWKQLVFAA
jgi:hypothetical protein